MVSKCRGAIRSFIFFMFFLFQSAYGSPVRIAAASGIDRGESFIDANSADKNRRGRSTSSGAIGPSGGSRSQEKYADARTGQLFNGGSTRLFIPRHGGGISAATFASGFSERPGGSSSPNQYRRRDNIPSNRFPQY